MLAHTLDSLAQSSHLYPRVRKADLLPGDVVIIRTVKSEYRLRMLSNGLFETSGGWFDKRGLGPNVIGVAGATWGGSAIMPGVLAACGMRVEFKNRLITSPVRSITLIPALMCN